MPGPIPGMIWLLSHGIHTTTLCGKYRLLSSFCKYGDQSTDRLTQITQPEVTQLGSDHTGIWTHGVWPQYWDLNHLTTLLTSIRALKPVCCHYLFCLWSWVPWRPTLCLKKYDSSRCSSFNSLLLSWKMSLSKPYNAYITAGEKGN